VLKFVPALIGFLCFVYLSVTPAVAHAPYNSGPPVPLELPDECRFLSIWVEYPRYGSGMSSRDLVLNARIAGLMKREFSKLGHGISDGPDTAYWALAIMASNTGHRQFALSATLELRNLGEGRNSGLIRYPRPGELTAPTAYTALIHGSRRELRERVREYVHRADTALLATSQALCTYEAQERNREREMEQRLRDMVDDSAPPLPEDPWIPPLSELDVK
jgi:hypothetical protein